jgi:cell division protein FtsL
MAAIEKNQIEIFNILVRIKDQSDIINNLKNRVNKLEAVTNIYDKAVTNDKDKFKHTNTRVRIPRKAKIRAQYKILYGKDLP